MARQQRPKPQPTTRASVSRRATARQASASSESATADLALSSSSYAEALRHYERAMRALQNHQFDRAATALREVLDRFPDEKELTDRARLYLAVCDRHLQPPPPEPLTTGDRLYAATLAINAGDASRAIALLDRVCRDEPGHDQAQYLMAVAYGLQGEPQLAVPFLQRAIEANAGNRARARVDPDLDALRHEARIAALLQPPPSDGASSGRGSRKSP